MHNARKESLMKNKKLLGVLSLLLATGLILGGCNKKPTKSSEETPTSSDSQKQVFTVKFVVEGETVQTSQVEEGALAVFEGQTPTKATSAGAFKTLFKGWDKDLSQPIKADTTFTALFGDYLEEAVVETFESYTSDGDLHDNGQWIPIGWDSTAGDWKDDTGGSVHLGSRAYNGTKSLRFDAWENGVTYKFGKRFTPAPEGTQSVNALQFSLLANTINTVNVIIYAEDFEYEGQTYKPSFTYTITPNSNEFVKYTIPLDGDWALWGDKAQYGTLASNRYWTGIHQDDIMTHLTKIEVALTGNAGGSAYVAFFDNLKFVTLDNPAFSDMDLLEDECQVYTGKTASGLTVKLQITGPQSATATILDSETPMAPINGALAVDMNTYEVTFTSEDSGATLVYKCKLVDGGTRLKYISASGSLANEVKNMDFNGVQVLDDFELYSSSGKAYYQSNKDESQLSGMRGAYYSEYDGGGGSSEYTKGTWDLMGGTGEQMNLINSGGHNGSKYGSFKGSKSQVMRYMQWEVFKGTAERISYHGSKLSFWAKSNSTLGFQVTAYSTPKADYNEEKQNVSCKKTEMYFYVGAIGSWQHFELDLNPGLTYYGYSVLVDHNYIRDAALFIDDVEIYSASPYAKYEAPAPQPADVLPTGAYVTKVNSGADDAYLNVKDGSNAVLQIPAQSIQTSATYTYSNGQAVFTFEGGTVYTVNLSADKKTLQYVSATGGTEAVRTALTNANFVMPNYAENFEEYEESGVMYCTGNVDTTTRRGLRGAYHADMYNPSGADKSAAGDSNWSLTPAGGEALSLLETGAQEGKKAMAFAFGSTNMRYIQWKAFEGKVPETKGVSHFGIYFKNPNDTALTVRVLIYKVTKVVQGNIGDNSKRVTKDITIPASSDWAFYTVDLDSGTSYYGFGLNTITKTASADVVKFAYADLAYFF